MDDGLARRLDDLRLAEEAARATAVKAMAAGLGGALAMTATHETLRRIVPRAPRLDRVGTRALSAAFAGLGGRTPGAATLHGLALAGDLVANGLYYGLLLTYRPFRPWTREALGGAVAGVGAWLLPPALGLTRARRRAHARSGALTVGLYVVGGLAAAAVFRLLAPRPEF